MFLGTEGSEISQMCPVKCWNHLINYFEYIGDFPSDVLQWGMYADGLLLHIYSCIQGGKDCLGHMEVMVYVHLNSLGVLHGRNLVLLAGKLKQWPFHSIISLLFMSPRNTLNSEESSELWVCRGVGRWRDPGSEEVVLLLPGLMPCVSAHADLGPFGPSVSQSLSVRCRQSWYLLSKVSPAHSQHRKRYGNVNQFSLFFSYCGIIAI